jgi:hypothetical protein
MECAFYVVKILSTSKVKIFVNTVDMLSGYNLYLDLYMIV